MEVVRIGNYKSYGENYISDKMSEELKTELTRIFDNRYEKFIDNIAKVRKIDKNTLDNDIINGNNTSLTPFAARDKKLVDKLEGFQDLTQRLGITEEKMVDIYDYHEDHSNEIEAKNKGNDAIAVIYAEGAIIDGAAGNDNSISISPDNIAMKIEKALRTPNLKGIVLRVNSPGGSALASEVIYQTLLKANIPIYVSMSETAASGGYYMSVPANWIVAEPTTITGSIGIFGMFPDFSGLASEKLGIKFDEVKTNKNGTFLSPMRPLTPDEMRMLQVYIDRGYNTFKDRVAQGRKLTMQQVETIAQGHVYTGEDALKIKLVDELGGLDKAVQKAVQLAAQAIRCGDADIIVAGGAENMSQAPYVLPSFRWGGRMGDSKVVDTMIKDGLSDAFNEYHMGITAESVAEEYGISREEQDALALESQKRAVAAIESGRFKEEIVPVVIPQRKGDPIIFDTDEYPRKDASLESLSKLGPVFKKEGSVTAGNASGINDGAAAVLVMSAEKAEELGLSVIARIRSYASAGLDPKMMGCGPIYATRKALEKGNLTVEDLDLIESNEAFAAQACAVGKTLGFNTDIVNVNGGAIALGHPIGASGCRILVTLLHEMMKRDAKTGLATLCIGGGMGTALIVER